MKKVWNYFEKHWQQYVLGFVLVLGLWLRVEGLATKAQVDLVQTDFGRDVLVGRHIVVGWGGWLLTPHSSWQLLSSSPLHFWLVGLAYMLTGSEIGVYYAYAMVSMVAVWLALRVGEQIGGKNLGLIMAAMTAVSPIFIGYATLVSQISLVPILAAVVVWGLMQFHLKQESFIVWVVMLSATAMMLLHNSGLPYGLFVGITMIGLSLFKKADWKIWLHLLCSMSVMMLSVWLLVFVTNEASFSAVWQAVAADVARVQPDTFLRPLASVLKLTHVRFGIEFLLIAVVMALGWLWWHGRSVAKLWIWLLMSLVLVLLAPISATGGFFNHYFGPWVPVLTWTMMVFPWLMKQNWLARSAKVLVLFGCLWLVMTQSMLQPAFPRSLVAQAPLSLMQLLHADAIQTGFAQEGFEIWAPIWEVTTDDPRADVLSDWYSGGWWFLWERLERESRVALVPSRMKNNNITVTTVGGGLYVICPDDLQVSSQESDLNLQTYQVPLSVMGNQWLSQPTGECLSHLWRNLADDAPRSKTWVLGRVLAPGSKTGAYALVKYHN